MEDKVIRVTSNRVGAGLVLGSLEYEVYKACCAIGKATVREIVDHLSTDHAYTTIMTTCDRLSKKGVLKREKCGKSYVYMPSVTQEEMDVKSTCRVLNSVIGSLTEPVMANFLEMLENSDSNKLDMLERMIKERKQNAK